MNSGEYVDQDRARIKANQRHICKLYNKIIESICECKVFGIFTYGK